MNGKNLEDTQIEVTKEEYARIMKAFIDKEIDYETISNNAYLQWCKVTPELMGNAQLNIYKELLKNT